MIKILSVLMLSVLLCAGAGFPVFIGDTSNYLTNRIPFIDLMVSNGSAITVNKTNRFTGFDTNNPQADVHVGNNGTLLVDSAGDIRGGALSGSTGYRILNNGDGFRVMRSDNSDIAWFRASGDFEFYGFEAAPIVKFMVNFGDAGFSTNSPFARLHVRQVRTNAIARFDSSSTLNVVAILTNALFMQSNTVLQVKSGGNQRAGNLTLIAGTLTVANTSVTASTIVMLTRKTSGGTLGTAITYTLNAGVSFTVNSDSALDTSVFSYFLIENP